MWSTKKREKCLYDHFPPTAQRHVSHFPSLIFLIIYNSFDNKPTAEGTIQLTIRHAPSSQLPAARRDESKWFDIRNDNKYSLKCDTLASLLLRAVLPARERAGQMARDEKVLH